MLPKVDFVFQEDGDIPRVVFMNDICDEWSFDDDKMMREVEEFAVCLRSNVRLESDLSCIANLIGRHFKCA